MSSGIAQIEAAPDRCVARAAIHDLCVRVVGQLGIAVQEDEDKAVGDLGAFVEAVRARARNPDHLIGEWTGEERGLVAAAAVDDNDLDPALTERFEREQRLRDGPRFVQNRHND